MHLRNALIFPLMIVASSLMAQERTRPLNPSIDSLFPSKPTAYLTDMANIVRNAAEVNARLAVIRKSNQLSLVAVTLPSLGRFDVADVAREIGRSWMVATRNDTAGAVVRNTGGVILISMSPRKCRVEVATGSEGYMTDMRAANACRNAVAALKAGNFSNGIISIANEFVRYHNEELASQSAARAEAARPKAPPKPFPWNTVITIVSVLVILCLPVLYYLNKRQKELEKIERIKARLEAEKAAERQRVWQIEEDKRRAKERAAQAERDRIAVAKEKARWDALTREQQQAELRQRQKDEEEAERQLAVARRKREAEARAEEVAERIRRRHQDEEEAERRSHQSHYSNDSNYSSNNSSDSSYSSGGSDSFSGGGGGSDF